MGKTRTNKAWVLPEPARLAVMLDALMYGEGLAARIHGVSRPSIRKWFEPLGGFTGFRGQIDAIRLIALAVIERSTATEYARRVSSLTREDLLEVVKAMIRASARRADPGGAAGDGQVAQASASAQSLTVNVTGEQIEQVAAQRAAAKGLLAQFRKDEKGS